MTATEDDDLKNRTIDVIIFKIKEQVNWNALALFFSVALLFQVFLKIMFNICTKEKSIPLDKWTVADFFSAIFNMAAVFLITYIDPEILTIAYYRDWVNNFMIFVLCVSWLRFFTYFLVIKMISKLLLTLVHMILDTISFMFIIICCYLPKSGRFASTTWSS